MIFVLGALLLASIFLTGAIVTLAITLRLMQHLAFRRDLKQGFLGWAQETRSRLGWPITESNGPLVMNGDRVKKEASAVSGSDGRDHGSNGQSP